MLKELVRIKLEENYNIYRYGKDKNINPFALATTSASIINRISKNEPITNILQELILKVLDDERTLRTATTQNEKDVFISSKSLNLCIIDGLHKAIESAL